MSETMDAPPDFKPLFRTSPALDLVVPLYSRGCWPD